MGRRRNKRDPLERGGDHASMVPAPHSKVAVCGLLALLVAVVFGQTLRHDFIDWDDVHYVLKNPHVHEGLSAQTIAWAFTARSQANWHPLTWISHILDWQMYGSWAGGHHLTSVLLHAATAIVLFLALLRMTGRLGCSALVAALFAIHPLRAESVAWVAERKDVLSGLFFALTLWAYAGYARHAPHPSPLPEGEGEGWAFSWPRYALVAGFFALGLMAKPMLVTLPFVLLLLDYWPLGRAGSGEQAGTMYPWSGSGENAGYSLTDCRAARGGRRISDNRSQISDSCSLLPAPRSLLPLVAEKLPLLAFAAASCAVTIWAQRGAMENSEAHTLGYRAANAVVAYGQYIAATLWPANLAIYYPRLENGWPAWLVAVSGTALAGISVAAIWARRRLPYLFSGWFWYVGMLVPVIGLVQVGTQARADRYTYLPQIGLWLALVWGADAAWQSRRLSPRLAWAAGGLVVLALAVCAARQVSFWHDDETLWRHAVASTSENGLAHANLASNLRRRGALPEAIEQFQIAFEIEPRLPAGSLNNYGLALRQTGRLDEAIEFGRRAVQAKPEDPSLHENLALAFRTKGLWDQAIAEYQAELELQPEDSKSRFNLAQIFARLGRQEDAVREYRAILAGSEHLPNIHFHLANALAAGQALEAAIEEYRKALGELPADADIWHNLGATLQRCGRLGEAAGALQKAVELQPGNQEFRNHLAVVLGELYGKGKPPGDAPPGPAKNR